MLRLNVRKINCLAISLFIALFMVGCQSNDSQSYATATKRPLDEIAFEYLYPNQPLQDLARAAGKGDIAQINEMVKQQGIDVNSKGTRNVTALFWARENKTGFEQLLKLGADPNVLFEKGFSVLHWLVMDKQCSLLKTTLNHGGDANVRADSSGKTPLAMSFSFGKNVGLNQCFNDLIAAGADINAIDNDGQSPMIVAAMYDRFDVVLALMDLGADTTIKSHYNMTVASATAKSKGRFIAGSKAQKNWQQVAKRLGIVMDE